MSDLVEKVARRLRIFATSNRADSEKIAQALVDLVLEEAAKVAERDLDWPRFWKQFIEPWENGPDNARDYRLGVISGRAIAAAIRSLKGDADV